MQAGNYSQKNGSLRELKIPTVRDRIVQQALRFETITPVPLVEVRNYIDRLWQIPAAATNYARASAHRLPENIYQLHCPKR